MKKLFQYLFFVIVSFGQISCKKEPTKSRNKEMFDNYYDPKGELDSVKQVILNLDMVKNLDYVPTIMSPRMTIDENDSIHYQIGENTKSRFRPEFNFYYYRKTKQLKFLDTITDSLIVVK